MLASRIAAIVCAIGIAGCGSQLVSPVPTTGFPSTDASQRSTGNETTIFRGFAFPRGVAVDSAGTLYVADPSLHAVRKMTVDGRFTRVNAHFDRPTGLAFDSAGSLYVTDPGNGTVNVVASNGRMRTITGFGYPNAVAVDRAENIYVADTRASAIVKIARDGTRSLVGHGFADPAGVAVDRFGSVFVADPGDGDVKRVAPSGKIATIARGGEPFAVATDDRGDLYVADGRSFAVYEISASGKTTTIASLLDQPDALAVDASHDVYVAGNNAVFKVRPGGAVSRLGLSAPTDVAVDASGRVLVADPGNAAIFALGPNRLPSLVSHTTGTRLALDRSGDLFVLGAALYEIKRNGTILKVLGGYTFAGGLAVDANENIYFAAVDRDRDSATICKFSAGKVRAVAYGFKAPSSIAAGANGTIYVADWIARRVYKISEGGRIDIIGPAFSNAYGVTVDRHENVYVADKHAVFKIATDGATSIVATHLSYPEGLAVDNTGNLFVADTNHGEVRKIALGP